MNMNYLQLYILLLIGFASTSSFGFSHPEWTNENRIRIREAIRINEIYGDQVFIGMKEAPFAILLLCDSTAFLINHDNPSDDFILLKEKDEVLNIPVYYRPLQYPNYYLATFPAVNGIPTIVIGTPENTNLNSTEWVTTLLHEHFHQLQMSDTKYYDEVNNLDLAGGDDSGMWMLNYPFPYHDNLINTLFKKLAETISGNISSGNNEKSQDLIDILTEIKSQLSEKDYAYFNFQIWQEGIARFVESHFLENLIHYTPSIEFTSLPDYASFGEYYSIFLERQRNGLSEIELNEEKRISFYVIGWGLGIILDRYGMAWKNKYFEDKFYLEEYFKAK